jgi:mono/diheme cytochrome c family protein
MNDLFDILLRKPLPDVWMRGLLFTSFTLHIVFVLFTVGTAFLSLYYFIDALWGGKPDELRMDKRILRTFMAHKSLAVVLGVAPLLLIQVNFSVPFFIGVYLLAPLWMLITVFLIVAFLFFDTLGHKLSVHRYLHLPSGIIAFGFLLVVPALFVAVLVTAENSDRWMAMINNGYRLRGLLAQHWLFRYLHVLGAALVFGAAFHYFFSAKDEIEKRSLLKLIVAGILVQIILGIMLYSSLPEKPDHSTNVSLFVGVIAAAVLLWLIFSTTNKSSALNIKTVLPVLMLILVPMLLTRQFIQDRNLIPFEKQLQVNAQAYQKELQPYNQAVLNKYESDMNIVYDNGETIYMKSCAFCHGEKADSGGRDTKKLAVPPEDVSAIRTTRPYLHKILTEGVPGSAMPYFTFFDKYKLDSLIDYLDKKYYVLGLPEPIPVKIPDKALQQAQKIYGDTCSQCHGMDGRGSALSRRFQPPPPDFTAYSLLPERAFDVITKGYSGTAMPSFGSLQKDLRWGLVKIINDKRAP